MAQAESTSAKWEAYHASDSSPPWESHDVTPQLNKLLNEISGKVDFTTLKAIELGCGDGKNVLHFMQRGFASAVGNEVSVSAIAKCQATEKQHYASSNPADMHDPTSDGRAEWLQGDMLEVLNEERHRSAYDIVFDCQVFHVMRAVDEAAFVRLVHFLLAPGGLYITVAGNAEESARSPGPPVLTAAQVVTPFETEGLHLVRLQRTRFAQTAAYGAVPPAAWTAVFHKPSPQGTPALVDALTT